MPDNYWAYLGLTTLIEILIVVLTIRFLNRTGTQLSIVGWTTCGLNMLSHPIAWFSLHQLGAAAYWPIELGVILLEAMGYQMLIKWTWSQALLISAIANVITLAIGWLI